MFTYVCLSRQQVDAGVGLPQGVPGSYTLNRCGGTEVMCPGSERDLMKNEGMES